MTLNHHYRNGQYKLFKHHHQLTTYQHRVIKRVLVKQFLFVMVATWFTWTLPHSPIPNIQETNNTFTSFFVSVKVSMTLSKLDWKIQSLQTQSFKMVKSMMLMEFLKILNIKFALMKRLLYFLLT